MLMINPSKETCFGWFRRDWKNRNPIPHYKASKKTKIKRFVQRISDKDKYIKDRWYMCMFNFTEEGQWKKMSIMSINSGQTLRWMRYSELIASNPY